MQSLKHRNSVISMEVSTLQKGMYIAVVCQIAANKPPSLNSVPPRTNTRAEIKSHIAYFIRNKDISKVRARSRKKQTQKMP